MRGISKFALIAVLEKENDVAPVAIFVIAEGLWSWALGPRDCIL
jgi:hypothetical protein